MRSGTAALSEGCLRSRSRSLLGVLAALSVGCAGLVVAEPMTSAHATTSVTPVQYSVSGDYDGDGRTDVAVWRPATGTWFIRGSAPIQYGVAGDIPVPGNYNATGKTDIAVWRPSTGTWYIRGSAPIQYGAAGDIPVSGASYDRPVPATLNQQIATYAETFVGKYPYTDGGTSPATGFDCSGLTQYVYQHYGRTIARTAQAQYGQFRQIPLSSALPGDLVFFHDDTGYVFHVGVYEGSNMMVAAATPQDGIRYQSIWSSNVSYGTTTH